MNVGTSKKGDARTREAGYEALATAVVGQAISDYYYALTNTSMRYDPVKAEERVKLEQFFASQIFVLYSEQDGVCLMNQIRQEAWLALQRKAAEQRSKEIARISEWDGKENDYGSLCG